MMREGPFLFALGVSVLGHATLFVLLPSQMNPTRLLQKRSPEVEVTYFQVSEIPQWGKVADPAPPEEEISSAAENPLSATEAPAAASLTALLPQELPLPAEVSEKTLPEAGRKEATDLEFEEEALQQEMASRLSDPVFMSYYQGIRQKIRKAAERRYQRRVSLGRGDVSLKMTLFQNGRLKDIRVLTVASRTNSALHTLAVQSLLDASPFPPFPDPLKENQLSLHVVLTFKTEP